MTRNLPFTVRAEVDPWYSKYFIIRNFKRTPTCAHILKNVDLKKKIINMYIYLELIITMYKHFPFYEGQMNIMMLTCRMTMTEKNKPRVDDA